MNFSFEKVGNGIIFNGDCIEVIPCLIDLNIRVDSIITDIPYVISKDNNFKTMKVGKRNGIDFGEWDKEFDISKLSIFPYILNENGCVVIFHSFEQYLYIKDVFEKNDLICKDRIFWEKTNPMPRNRNRRYITTCELASWYVKQKSKWTFNRIDSKYQKMNFQYPVENGKGNKRYHPTQKNLKLIEDLVKIHTNENDTVIDPFMGSGTTCVACQNLNRKFIGIELNTEYYNIAKKRILENIDLFNQ